MSYRVRPYPSGDDEFIREWYREHFPLHSWMGPDQEHWIVEEPRTGLAVGFCSALLWQDLDCVFLSAAALTPSARGGRLQMRLIQTREQWARKAGARWVLSYVACNNYASLYNLMRAGYRAKWTKDWHILYKHLYRGKIPDKLLRRGMRRVL